VTVEVESESIQTLSANIFCGGAFETVLFVAIHQARILDNLVAAETLQTLSLSITSVAVLNLALVLNTA
jgi:hypothetical protein